MRKLKIDCYLCKEEKECIETIIYEKENGYNMVYLCLKCYKNRYGEIKEEN